MYSKISLLVLIASIQISCTEVNDKTFINTEKSETITSPTPEKIIEQPKIPLYKTDKRIIYWMCLARIFHDDENGDSLGSIGTGYMPFRIETVSPLGINQIENIEDISQSLINDFKAVNQKPERLEVVYPTTFMSSGVSGSRDLSKFYNEVKRKDPKTTGAVCFSNIGVDDSYSQALVYAEYFRPERGLVKFYVLMTLETYGNKYPTGQVSGAKIYKLIQVN